MIDRVLSILRSLYAVVFVCASTVPGVASYDVASPPGGWSLETVPELVSADTFEISVDVFVAGYLGVSLGEALFVRLAGIDAVQMPQRCGVPDDPWPCGREGLSWLAARLGSDPLLCVAPLQPALRPALVYRALPGLDSGLQPVRRAFPVSAHAVRCSTPYLGDLATALVGAGWALPVPGASVSLHALARSAARDGVGVYASDRSGSWELVPADWLLSARAASRAVLTATAPTPAEPSALLDSATRARHLSADPLFAADRLP